MPVRPSAFPWIPAIALFFSASPAPAFPAQLVEDTPGLLRLEVRLPEVTLVPGPAKQTPGAGAAAVPAQAQGFASGAQILCAPCQTSAVAGAPDLPVHRFQVASGPAAPKVTLRILESEARVIPEGIRPYPFSISPTRQEYRVDPALYGAAATLSAQVSGLRWLRGVPVRSVEVPLALWNEATHTLTLLKRVAVEVAFPRVQARPSPFWPATLSRLVANPVGGKYQFAPASRPALRKGAAARAVPKLGAQWIKIKVGDKSVESLDEDRVYSVSGAELLQASDAFKGASLASLRLYAGPNDTLPRRMTGNAVGGTLRQVAIELVDKGGINVLDAEDTLRFFGHGTSIWKRTPTDSGSIKYEFSVDPYSFENYYFLTFASDEAATLRLVTSPSASTVGAPITSGYHYLRAEQDLQSCYCDPGGHLDQEGGFEWFWAYMGSCGGKSSSHVLRANTLLDKTVDTLEDWASESSDTLFLGVNLYPPTNQGGVEVHYAGSSLPLMQSPWTRASYFAATGPFPRAPALALDSMVVLGAATTGFDGYTVAYPRRHVYHNKPLWIFPGRFGASATYRVEGGAGLLCLRVEDGEVTRRLRLDESGVFTDSLDSLSDARYYVYGETSRLPTGSLTAESLPAAGSTLADLASGAGDPEYLIVTSKDLLVPALALRDYRNDSKRALRLRTQVVLTEDIYRQFSGGRLTPVAIRDFLRWAYSGWSDTHAGPGALRYVLLMGDGHFDHRNIKASLRADAPPNVVPPFEYYPSSSGSDEIASDDFFGLLDTADSMAPSSALDLAVGRLPVQNETQAMNYLRKVQAFESAAKAGEWRGRIVLAADDNAQRESFDGMHHTRDTEAMARAIKTNEPGVSIDKVYLLDYPINASQLKPEASQDLLSLMNRGTLLVNYTGHGSSNQWADEILLQTSDALSRLHNQGMTPLVSSFACTVGKFDSQVGEGMSEQFVKQPDVGAIAAVSATRESYPDPNKALAVAFLAGALPDTSVAFATVGDALMEAKGDRGTFDSNNNRRYGLLGEPVLLLRKPQLRISITQAPDTIQALDCRSLRGTIAGGSGHGFVNLKIVAGSVKKTFEVRNPRRGPDDSLYFQTAEKRGNVLFERTVEFKNHEFTSDYFIPKQISFGDTNALIQAFAWDGTEEMEGQAAILNLRIAGTAKGSCPADDGRGPHILVTGCEAKETGKVDFPDQVRLSLPYCLQIEVEDPSGGVMSSDGPDEGTTLEIPGVLDPYHPKPGLDELARKTYQVSLDRHMIRPGPHLLKVSTRDGYGNISRRQLRLEVTADSSLAAIAAYNVPNPMKSGGTAFHFSMGLPAEQVEVVEGATEPPPSRLDYEIRIFDQRGYQVKALRGVQSGQTWDGRDEWGNRLANGVYFYKVIGRQNTALLGDPNPGYRTHASKRNVLVISR